MRYILIKYDISINHSEHTKLSKVISYHYLDELPDWTVLSDFKVCFYQHHHTSYNVYSTIIDWDNIDKLKKGHWVKENLVAVLYPRIRKDKLKQLLQ